ncbi:DUF927 domain-containing protein [Gemmobacter straminiformis]|uniref:DUF927 domain-containing protein n=2 Tax=Paragemmobacter straminiformis TaxID=2045119 RepID=A0A842I4R4_9RHOB|nr:DUF927 domain-containing protein [Gemmobacter straminiformis]
MNSNAIIASHLHSAEATPPELPDDYAMFDDGVYYLPQDGLSDPIYVCSPLRIDATRRSPNGTGWGKLVSVRAPDGSWRDISVTNSDLTCHPSKVVGKLVDHGLELGADRKSKERLLDLLRAWKPGQSMLCVERSGWVDSTYSAFVAGGAVLGDQRVVPKLPAGGHVSATSRMGSAGEWKAEVGLRCIGNPLMILAASVAFSGPLLAPLGMPSGGVHFRGASSSGKTTLLRLAASAWGSPDLISPWRATSNGLEATAAALNGMLLPLDEIAEIAPRDLHAAIYMLGNGSGKARMTMEGTLQDTKRWQLAYLSSGEISAADKLAEAGVSAMAGHEVRLIDIESDAHTYGVFDDLHGETSPAKFADTVRRASQTAYGTAGPAFVEYCIEIIGKGKLEVLRSAVDRYAASWVLDLPSAPDGQIERVAQRLALVAISGTVATKAGLTGWGSAEARDAAHRAFLDWYDYRYASKREASDAFVSGLQRHVAANLSGMPDVQGPFAAGVCPDEMRDETRAYFSPVAWGHVFRGLDATKAAKALFDMGLLLGGDGARLMRKAPRSVPGRPRLYVIDLKKLGAYRAN